jgi:hypothetical protein
MLSIIICSRHKALDKEFVDNIAATVGVDYELINVDNSENTFTIFSAYNEGTTRSKFPYLCFVHEDIRFHTQGWGERVISHLQDPKTGIVGMAGADLVVRVPAAWTNTLSYSHNILQTDLSGKHPTELLFQPEGYTLSKRTTVTLDGILLAMRKELMQKIRFDESLKGFHGYDYDISLQSTIAGYQNYVIYDIRVEHFSRGKTNVDYFRNLIAIYKKFENHFPIIGSNISTAQLKTIPEFEVKKLYQLTKKMVRKGFSSKEIKTEISYFARLIGYPKAAYCLSIRVFFIRLFNAPKYLFKP